MAKVYLVKSLGEIKGKFSKSDGLCFRKTPSGGNSVYIQAAHSYRSLHSPAQERHRALLAAASVSASAILADVGLREVYMAQWQASGGRYLSLQRYVVHLEYERMKGQE